MLDPERAHPRLEPRRARHDRLVPRAPERLREREHRLNVSAGVPTVPSTTRIRGCYPVPTRHPASVRALDAGQSITAINNPPPKRSS